MNEFPASTEGIMFEEIKTLKKNVKRIKIAYFSLFALFLLVSTITGISIFVIKKDVVISYENLTSDEINLVNKVLNDLNPLFLEGQKSITFTKNLTDHRGLDKYLYNGEKLAGFNKPTLGIIYIKFQNDEDYLRKVTCHELLHTHMKYDGLTHKIVYYLEDKEVCYD